jgi:hypothetical protein
MFVYCLFYCPLRHNQASIQNRIGIICNLKTLVYAAMIRSLSCYPQEKAYFLREYADRSATPMPFLITHALPYLLISAG